jgi:hypothetical protein
VWDTQYYISYYYQFDGFFRPVQMGLINSAQPGRTIPMRGKIFSTNSKGSICLANSLE